MLSMLNLHAFTIIAASHDCYGTVHSVQSTRCKHYHVHGFSNICTVNNGGDTETTAVSPLTDLIDQALHAK